MLQNYISPKLKDRVYLTMNSMSYVQENELLEETKVHVVPGTGLERMLMDQLGDLPPHEDFRPNVVYETGGTKYGWMVSGMNITEFLPDSYKSLVEEAKTPIKRNIGFDTDGRE